MRVFRIKNYPWYQELPSVICLTSVLLSAAVNWEKFPHPLAIHFNSSGSPNGYGSKSFTLILLVSILLVEWFMDTAIRYQWLLGERNKKRFNWIQILTNPGIVATAASWHLIANFNLATDHPTLGWAGFFTWILLGLVSLVVMELRRPLTLADQQPIRDLGPDFTKSLPEKFCIVDHVAPRWWVWLMAGPGVAMIVGGVAMLFVPSMVVRASGVLTIFGGLLSMLFAGGFRFVVHHRGVDVNFGTLSIPILSLRLDSILGVELQDYNALSDYGGWGLRWGRDNTTAYIISGERGVLIRTGKRNYLLGTEMAPAFLSALSQLLERRGPLK
jgi:Domain of unknown function (DUF1648)